MKVVELDDDKWAFLKRMLMNRGADEALRGYTPPIKLTHGNEYVIFEKEGFDDDSDTDN